MKMVYKRPNSLAFETSMAVPFAATRTRVVVN
jgi:hypothetical protein